ncbi:hypothetical protein HOP62_01915 [Halomonas sp. MCCC 1A17488]|uniref:hypothetical protein n=1 Tax=unclassified Halomonas TaxID=2609666 RepID=UPI0018D270B7|nr:MULTISPECIES: hypothetical protein [unclassified Halomonas]MCE8014828.1 hypothetical protein [Halomonas sp. MCCC 1A17488]MCG3238161.1 hypothetical protein [Halomonas sp. MCCC 1A17488]QPP48071.1 hypothetical protein I4484_12485 [Halomonas sp. SS10-MC5]
MTPADDMPSLVESGQIFLDIEFGNSVGYYSFKNHSNKAQEISVIASDISFSPELFGTHVTIGDRRKLSNNELLRAVKFSFCEVSKVYDLVSRFVVYSSNDRPAKINDKEIVHKNSNIYYQYPVTSLRVPVSGSTWLDFDFTFSNDIEGMQSVCYVRDEKRDALGYRWIVHQRMIADPEKSNLIIRSCNPRYEGVLPYQSLYPRWLKKQLFRIRERKYPSFPVMAVGEATVEKGMTCSLGARVKVVT